MNFTCAIYFFKARYKSIADVPLSRCQNFYEAEIYNLLFNDPSRPPEIERVNLLG